MVPLNCRATVGVVGNGEHNLINVGKAGRKRHMGIRPTVRGSVMNPNYHPHGGGAVSYTHLDVYKRQIVRWCIVITVAIGGLHDHIVCSVRRNRVSDERLIDISNITGENNFF